MINYFESKSIKDFKNSKLFWQFYSASINIKSSKQIDQNSITIEYENQLISEPHLVGDIFNNFFTSLTSNSLATSEECNQFVSENFNTLKKENILQTKVFSFVQVTEPVVNKLLKNIDPSNGPGISAIPSKVLKESADELTPVITVFSINVLLIKTCQMNGSWL